MGNKILQVNNLSFSYGKKQIFKDANLELCDGEVVGIIGKNGCGKTTLLKLLTGLVFPTDGTILFSENCQNKYPRTAGILESPKLIDYMTGDENLRYYLGKNYNSSLALQEFKNWKISEFAETSVKKYSLGMRQKIALMIAFLSTAPVLIFDEPTNSLDFESVKTFYSYVDEAKKQGRAIVIVTHIRYELDKHCTRIFDIQNNSLKEIMSENNFKRTFEITFTNESMANNASNLLTGEEIEKLEGNCLTVNELERPISAIIRILSQYDMESVVKNDLCHCLEEEEK